MTNNDDVIVMARSKTLQFKPLNLSELAEEVRAGVKANVRGVWNEKVYRRGVNDFLSKIREETK